MRIVVKFFSLALTLALIVSGGLAIYFYKTYGHGEDYADLTGAPILPAAALEKVVASDEAIGNATVSREGRIFYTIHPESNPRGPRLYEWRDGKPVPIPDVARQAELFATPLGLCVDSKNRLWVIDHGMHGLKGARLFAFDLTTGALAVDYRFPAEAAPIGSFLQDLRVDPGAETIYIADASYLRLRPAIVVFDIASKTARRVLEGHPSVSFQNWLIRNPIKPMSFLGGILELKIGIDGIAVDPSGAYVYWAAMNHDTLYRAPAADLKNAALSPAQLASKVEAVSKKPLSDGIAADSAGGVLITDVEHGAVLRAEPGKPLQTLVKDARIRWADGLSFGPDGYVYLADSAIPHLILKSRAHVAANAPYHVWRFKPPQAGIPGQ